MVIVKVIKAHVCEFPNPITFEKGDKLILGEHSTEFEGWVLTKTADGNEGWAPIQCIDFKQGENTGIGRCSYNALELDTDLNEHLSVIKELNSWYLVSKADGSIGWVPTDTVEIIE